MRDAARMSPIRYVAASPWEEDLFVAGEFERTAHVWSLRRRTEVAAVETILDIYWRLALVPGDAPVVVAGAWARHGVCGYSLSGERLWQNKARSAVQTVTALPAGRVAVCYGRGPAAVLDASTGDALASLRGIVWVHALAPDTVLLVGEGHLQLVDGDLEPLSRRITLGNPGVGVSAAAIGPECVAISAGEWLRIRSLDGEVRAARLMSVQAIAYEHATGTWRALTSRERRDSVRYELLRLSHDLEVLDRRPFDEAPEAVWMAGGTTLVYANDTGLHSFDGDDAGPRPLDQA